MNSIYNLFKKKNKNILCIYFTAGYPKINSTVKIIETLQELEVDIIEIGIPYSDPIADGLIIQKSNKISLNNGMNISILFKQIYEIKNKIKIPIILMGYFNQLYKFGINNFITKCKETNISGLIFPDLPVDIFIDKYQTIFYNNSISMIFLVTPKTKKNRIIMLNKITDSFLYVVQYNSTTGNFFSKKNNQSFLKTICKYISVPKLVGFGIHDRNTFNIALKYANGGIIGSSFIKSLDKDNIEESIKCYINNIL